MFFSSAYGFKLKLKPINGAISDDKTDELDPDEYWDMIKETISSPGVLPKGVTIAHYWFDNRLPAKGFSYVYGGKTAYKVQPGTSDRYKKIFACYLDNNDYSGVTITTGDRNSMDLQPLRKTRQAGIGFWGKGGSGNESVYIGLLDDDSDGKKVQTKVALRDFGKLDTSWRYFMIPLSRFQEKGKYWDERKKTEVLEDVNWSAVNEIRFSVNRGENGTAGRKPVKIYFTHVGIIDAIPGYIDPEKYWAEFSSDEPDLLLHDFEDDADNLWQEGTGPASKVTLDRVPATEPGCGTQSLAITYQLNDWCDAMYDYRAGDPSGSKSSWTKHRGIRLTVCSEKAYQSLNLQVSDAGNELYIASCGVPAGCTEVIVPFKEFYKFPYYQPPDARHDGTFDLDGVIMLDVKPAGEGTDGTFLIDNIALTNSRTVKHAPEAAEKEVAVTGDFNAIVTGRINNGIFGINAQHWDGDLLHRKSAEYVKKVGHLVIRFPGGLSADEYHWKEMLDNKDHNADIDEFLAFCRKTGCEPMLTVNFGTGTAEEAAAWVKYVNITRNAGVRYWEIGNELYGDWHKNHCSAEEYGKRAAEFITAMKKVDPDILITVVWEIESPWNRTVFDYTKNIADGVNIHNYPQESGEENDRALLASPQALEGIIGRVRKQLRTLGEPDRNYQIWLTEWNSVDFNPGPQSLGMVNALFVADYIGMLAKVNIEHASYWNIHNGMFVQGGDYGYLSRSDVPQGANIPRPSYWAFRLAAMSLRGSLVACSSDDINVSVYVNKHNDNTKSLLIINKYQNTTAELMINIPAFEGNMSEYQLTDTSGNGGYSTRQKVLKKDAAFTVPPGSITVLLKK